MDAESRGLVDEIITSDEYLYERANNADIFLVKHHERKKLLDRIAEAAARNTRGLLTRLWSDADRTRFGA
jgi:serine protease SohB